ncbi:iron complex transport system ATP-binding protein [Desulfonatronum thiosulfatophilum]|uniref:Iron complex transport system ATP-binding protein n=1 Tax=Desulfonatronum thiosulfatophilum TaxID=617002 RepID=A0A1G6A9L9_9BACT|nr:ATP-binding cassette domain-containing protein [Desulfonatronum thiosulfatophilum]SDB05127.1 iron complex transport system ATP-binding protein [Desulfonatronum thiosulfatophilum]
MQNILHIHNATVYRERNRVFQNLCLNIDRGQHTALLGPNGAGKTTLLKLLAREIYPMPGTDTVLRLFGQERWNVWDLRSRLGMVSQDLQQEYPGNVSGREVVLSGFRSSIGTYAHHHFSREEVLRTDQLLQALSVTELAGKSFRSMSTGQQRRLLLARALVNDPQALLLDEPTSGLDIKACFFYLDTIRELMRQEKTVILVTHHIHEIPPEMKRIVLLKNGRVVADGPKEIVLTEQAMADLFETPLRLLESGGYFQVVPA